MVERSTRRSRTTRCAVACAALAALLTAGRASAQSHRVELEFSPTKRVQMAVWVEKADGTFMGTLALTAATADRGIGNRPGALQMNSGYRWPYGRREGALPVWAHRRDAAPGAAHFKRVIFQDRGSEGYASQTSIDQSTDTYFCAALSTQASDSLDAVTCPSVFSSDKGRFITQQDVDAGYGEPFRQQDGANILRPLSLYSLYPPRRDVTEFGRYDHPDARLLAGEALRVMPNLDAITMATPDAAVPDRLAFALPADWPLGDYDLYIEVNTEADFNDVYDTTLFPTPKTAASQGPATWDVWAMTRGTPYRGQPSVVFRLPLALENGAEPVTVTTAEPIGYGEPQGLDGDLRPIDNTITDDPVGSPGSGADRLLLVDGVRATLRVMPVCDDSVAPPAVANLTVTPSANIKLAHAIVRLGFDIPQSATPLQSYEVQWSRTPDFAQPRTAHAPDHNAAGELIAVEGPALFLPVAKDCPSGTTDPRCAPYLDPSGSGACALGEDRNHDGDCLDPGDRIEADLALEAANTTYFVRVRAHNECLAVSPDAEAEVTTDVIHFTTVSPCFVATAAYGTPFAKDIDVLRRFRDAHLLNHSLGRRFVYAYYALGRIPADYIRPRPLLRAAVRATLRPVVALIRWLDDDDTPAPPAAPRP